MKKVGIIGAGVAGLAAAIRLTKAGFECHVFDNNSEPGGKLSQFTLGDYRFDRGPSLFTMPHYVDELLDLYPEYQTGFSYEKIAVSAQYRWDDQTKFSFYSNPEKLGAEINNALDASPKEVFDHLKYAEKLYNQVGKIFLENSLNKSSTWLSKDVGKALLKLPSYKLGKTMDEVNRKRFSSEKLVQLFNRYATYNGSNPYQAPALLNMIPHFDQNVGTFLPKKGMFQISDSIYKLAMYAGVNFHFNSQVDKILLEENIVKGIQTNEKKVAFDLVISNSDVHYTYTKLLAGKWSNSKKLSQPRSMSTVLFYWGINRAFPELDLHNVFFSLDYRKEFDQIYAKGFADDPTIYLNISAKKVMSDAPENCENWFVMTNVGPNNGQNWEQIIKTTRQAVLKKLSAQLGTEIKPLIVEEAIMDPIFLDEKLNSYKGSIYGYSSDTRMAAFKRQANAMKKLKGMYFCGTSAHPGGGVPVCLLSAKICSEEIISVWK
jgi:phytoene desaturase